MRFDLVLFDFDGTLADSFPWFSRVLNDLAREYGFRTVDAAEGQELRKKSMRDILSYLEIPLWKVPLVAERARKLMARDLASVSLFTGVPEMLRRFAEQSVPLGILSSNSEANIREALGPSLSALFRYFACGASMFGKPAKLLRVRKESGVAATRLLYVGDEIRDIEAGRRCGVAVGAVSWGYNAEDILRDHKPDYLFASFPEILAAVLADSAAPPPPCCLKR